ncbi:MAG: DUF1653 domain-containing protein [Alphaproteobacteria bacterium]
MKLGVYQHYKGNLYQVIGLARHSETLEAMVVYQALYEGFGLWVRPAGMFLEIISFEGKEVPRFKFVSEGLGQLPKVD